VHSERGGLVLCHFVRISVLSREAQALMGFCGRLETGAGRAWFETFLWRPNGKSSMCSMLQSAVRCPPGSPTIDCRAAKWARRC
jgi:hypothetical protein